MDQATKWNQFLKRIQYKPGWEIQAAPSYFSSEVELRARYSAPDAACPSVMTEVYCARAPSPFSLGQLDLMLNEVKALLKTAEDHEFKEWLRFDGEQVTNPHPELTP